MLKAIVNFLNLKLELLNYFDLTRCLCELKTKGDVVAPKEYIANGEWQNIDFDSSDGVSYWRLRDPITVTRESNPNKALKRVQTTVPMKLVFSVRRDKLTADDAYSFDRIRQTIVKQFNIDNGALTTALGAAKVTITAPSSDGDPLSVWESETSGTQTQEPDFKYVFGSVDIDIVIDSDTDCLPTECDDVDSDILHTFNFCDSAVIDRLTPEQITCLEDALCGVCADATVQLNGTTVGTVASGATGDFTVNLDGSPSGVWDGSAWQVTSPPCDDATIELNGVEMTTIPSGDTENILVLQSNDMTQVGSKQGTHFRIDDSAISINGSPVADVKAEDPLDIDVTQDGSPVGSWNGSEWIIPTVTGGATLEIGVFSDSGATIPITSADFGDTVYIKLTVVGITPTNYRFFICENNVNFDLIEQASNIYAKTISTFNDLVIYGEAEDGSIAACALDATTLTINADADANAFIAAHNAASGQVMATLQQEVIQGTFQRLKGTGTTYGSDLWTKLSNSNSEVYPFAPVSDSTVNASACAIDMIDPSVSATFTNFIPTDFDVTGITGGSTKYLSMKRAPSDYGQNDVGVDAYVRAAGGFPGLVAIGASASGANSNAVLVQPSQTGGFYKVNATTFPSYSSASNKALQSAQRTASISMEAYVRGLLVKSQAATSLSPTTNSFYGFANNTGSGNERNFDEELAMVASRCSFTTLELQDWNEVWEYYQSNIITGGRNV